MSPSKMAESINRQILLARNHLVLSLYLRVKVRIASWEPWTRARPHRIRENVRRTQIDCWVISLSRSTEPWLNSIVRGTYRWTWWKTLYQSLLIRLFSLFDALLVAPLKNEFDKIFRTRDLCTVPWCSVSDILLFAPVGGGPFLKKLFFLYFLSIFSGRVISTVLSSIGYSLQVCSWSIQRTTP